MEGIEQVSVTKQRRRAHKSRCLTVASMLLGVLLLISIVVLILAFTVFKAKQPKTKLVSAALDGVSPRISFPVVNIQLNVTLDLQLLVENPNHASFKHGQGKSVLSYRGDQFGEADIPPGNIPARGSATFSSRLVLQLDEMASNIRALIDDVLDGELVVDTRTRIPGRVTFLKVFKKHAVVTSECQFTIEVLALKLQSQKCKSKSKL
ncbi:Endomembrane protein 70 protein family [Hibiscus syriacus]|uniref:Endomembrane protein 70 protein family n=1 Tax=Hibiscus syriacus TaxID=106335 RepID=A0A6A3D2R4_HIBSY|nr:uncharacterized protein LOC120218800 [Hibiscus syriacus]KAE8734118.1 Endomembrane protein 70 protein family [Hibiscus syriacus]